MREKYKDFPRGWGHLKIPSSSRSAALAGLAMYAPCKRRAVWMHWAAWVLVSAFGPLALPGGRIRWQPPLESDIWSRLVDQFHQHIGPFDTTAIYERAQSHRSGVIMLLIKSGAPVAFVKIRNAPRREALAVEAISKFKPLTFHVPEILFRGEIAGWHYLATAPLPPQPHRVPVDPPLNLIVREIQAALSTFPRPVDTPEHWQPMHGDLTPWNLRQLHDGSLILIDWEEAGWGPPGADEVLYRASEAAVFEQPVRGFATSETKSYWEERVRARPALGERDKRLAASLCSALNQMRHFSVSARRPVSTVRRPRLLIFAYACEPGRGSEPGAGWGLVQTAAKFADCVVLVGPEHIPGIRFWEAVNDSSSMTFVGVPEAQWADRAKWHRIPWFLLYLFWLRSAGRVAHELQMQKPFDAVFHATYATYWLPTPATRLGLPAVWGPVGGAVTTPLRLWPALGWKGLFDELLDLVSVRVARCWPATRRTWREATVRLVQNEETLRSLPRSLRARSYILGHTAFIEMPPIVPRSRASHILYLSPLESRKGARLAVRALARTPATVRMLMAGDGPERATLERLAEKWNVSDRLEFLGHVQREKVFDLLLETAAVVFTNLREEGGISLGEAMLSGAPVIVLANGGTRTTASSASDPRRVVLIPTGGVTQTTRRLAEAMTMFVQNPSQATGPTLDQEMARRHLREFFEEAIRNHRCSGQREADAPLEDARELET